MHEKLCKFKKFEFSNENKKNIHIINFILVQ